MPAKAWEDFKQKITKLAEGKVSLYYRGQMNESWKLKTTFHRFASSLKITVEEYLTLILPEVRRHICAWTTQKINTLDPEENGAFLAMLQHHGFPTPLLDWTLSPYIAVYFAFREVDDSKPQTDNVKIYIFDAIPWSEKYIQPLNLLNTGGPFVSALLTSAFLNQRLIPQRGAYTLTNVENMEAHIKNAETASKQKFLYELTIPVREKLVVMRDLDLMGINEMTLFPGLDGICKTMKNQFFSPNEMGPTPSEINQDLLARIRNAVKQDQPDKNASSLKLPFQKPNPSLGSLSEVE